MNKFEGRYGTEESQKEFLSEPLEKQEGIIEDAREEAVKVNEKIEKAKEEGREVDSELAEKEIVWEDLEKRIGKTTDRLGEGVDEGIRETVVAFNALGLNTSQSCEGHTDHGIPAPWVDIAAPNKPEEQYVGQKEIYRTVAEKYNVSLDEVERSRHKEAWKKAVRESAKNEETEAFKRWLEKNTQLMEKTHRLLEEFYQEREADEPQPTRLVIKGKGGLEFRIHNGGEDYEIRSKNLTEEQQQEITPRLAQYQEEMRKFAEFLKKKYFEKKG